MLKLNLFRWELPIPGSKPYWDKICDDLERRKEHVSDSSNSPFPFLDEITGDESASIKSIKSIVEPVVKIFPPTPSRIFATRDDFIIDESFCERENKNQVSINIPSSISIGNLETDDINKETKISGVRKEYLSHDNVRIKKSCQLHKNTPALKIFDDNLKRFLPKNRVGKKLANSKLPSVRYENFSELSKLHRKKFCPLLGQSAFETRRDFGSGMIKGREEFSHSFEICETANSHNKRAKSNFDESFVTREPFQVNVRSKSDRYRISNKKSKSEILKSNLDDMLAIPILENIRIDENLSDFENEVDVEEEAETRRGEFDEEKSDGENSLEENFAKSFKTMNKKLPSLSDNSSRNLMSQKNFDAQKIDKNKTAVTKLPVKMEKEFLKVPKLGMISSYPSFSKLTPRESVETEDNKKSFNIEGSSEINNSKNLKISEQQVEPCKRDFLKVPKLGMMSSYASFNSLIPESLDSDDGAASSSGLTARRSVDDEPRSISIPKSSKSREQDALNSSENLTGSNFGNEKTVDFDESTEIPETCSEEIGLRIKSNRRNSLKDSVRYAYRALKFMTRNKNLDFKPQSYHRYEKSESSSRSSGSSRTSRYSKFEPPIKVLTYEDINKNRAAERSISSSSYGTVKSRLKQSASQYLGSDYIFVSSKARSATPSTTIPSLTRSTSGPTLDFQDPIYERPSEELLSRLPKMSIFPRRKYDKCLACLYKAFEVPVQPKRELPLTLWNAVTKERDLTLSESESSSISLPDVKDFPDSESKCDENWLEALENVKKSSLFDNTEWKLSRGSPRMNFDPHRPKQALNRPSEESPPLKNDTKSENLRRNMSHKDSKALNSFPKPLSLSSEHSKPSSLSGHSTESEEPQIQTTKPKPSSECFASPYAPLHWAPSLDPLKSLKLRKPVSMHGRAASITKTEDENPSDDDANDYRSTRKESKRKVADKNEGLSKPGVKFGDKSNLVKQPSVVAKIITSQLSAVATLTKKQSKVDLFSNDSKTESQTIPENLPEDGNLKTLEKRKKSNDQSPESYGIREPEGQTTEDSVSKSSLPQIPEQPLENGSESIAGDESCRVKNHERDFETGTGEIYSEDTVLRILENYLDENRTPFELLEALGTEAINNYPFNCEKTIINREIARSVRVAKNVIRLLIESKKYLNPETFSPNLEFSSPQTPLCNPRQLRRVLPPQTYNLVARILGMPENPAATKTIRHKSALKIQQEVRDPFKLRQSRHRALSDDSDDMIVSKFFSPLISTKNFRIIMLKKKNRSTRLRNKATESFS